MRSAPYIAPLLFALACGPSEPERMKAAIAPYVDEFAAYDRWARRTGLADSAFHSEEALRETAFATLEEAAPRARAAWLEREGPDPTSLAHPATIGASPREGWVRVTTESLGELAVAHGTLSLPDETIGCVFVRRSRPAPGGATLHVTLAFAPD